MTHGADIAKPQATFAPPRILLSEEEAAAALGVSVRKFHELRSEPWMCKPLVLGLRLLRWSRSELEQAVLAAPRQQDRAEPLHLAKARAARAGATEIRS